MELSTFWREIFLFLTFLFRICLSYLLSSGEWQELAVDLHPTPNPCDITTIAFLCFMVTGGGGGVVDLVNTM